MTQRIGANIARAINNVLIEFNLINKTLALTTDNESAMLVCGRILANNLQAELDRQTFHHYRCSAHILNLAARHGLEIVDQDIVNIRMLMSKIKGSMVLCDELKELCKMQKLDYLKPELDIVTRWNSTYYMLNKCHKCNLH